MRNIAAPFQKQSSGSIGSQGSVEESRGAIDGYIDYTNSKFVDLEPIPLLVFEKVIFITALFVYLQ